MPRRGVRRPSLADRFLIPPFSVLDARSGQWQERKRAWLSMGIQSEIGRGENWSFPDDHIGEDGKFHSGDLHAGYERDGEGKTRRPTGAPGGQPRPAMKVGEDGHTERGDGAGKPIRLPPGGGGGGAWLGGPKTGSSENYEKNGSAGLVGKQGAHSVYPGDSEWSGERGGKRLTYARDNTTPESMSDASRQNSAGGRGKAGTAKAFGSGGPAELATSYQSQDRLNALQRTGDSRATIPNSSHGLVIGPFLDPDSGQGEGVELPQTGTSIFDPVLCELAYRWFCPPGGNVLDPFAGGSVRGIVASVLGRKYVGIDLSERQIKANREQAKRITPENEPKWIAGDSAEVLKKVRGGSEVDCVFSCPPYADLEVYSNDPRDISNMPYTRFLEIYGEIISLSCARLKNDRFAVWVVGEVRDEKGMYRGLVHDTVAAFRSAGLTFYNDAVLLTAVGSLPIRTSSQFGPGRKLGRTHQSVLVFLKGDPKKAAAACSGAEDLTALGIS